MLMCNDFFLFCGKISMPWKFFYLFLMGHHISLSPGLNSRFNSSICCQWLALSIRPQHSLTINRFTTVFILDKTIPTTLYHFSSIKMVLFLFSCLMSHTRMCARGQKDARMLCYKHYDAMLRALIFCLTLF